MACTAPQLIDKLAESGTGTGKLAVFRLALNANPKATAHDLLAACEGKVPEDTMAKARAFAGDAPKPEPARAESKQTPEPQAGAGAGGAAGKAAEKNEKPATGKGKN